MPSTVFLGMPRISVGILDGLASTSRLQLVSRQASRSQSSLARSADHSALCQCRSMLRARHTRSSRVPALLQAARALSTSAQRFSETPAPAPPKPPAKDGSDTELHESPYTLPNALTIARIVACPFLAWSIVKGNFELATGLLVAGGLTDWVDGYLARKWNQKTVLGSILDPAADKMLVTTLVVTLTYKGLLPLPLAILIFGRDFGLSMWAFYLRYKSLPPPRTLKRYFDPTMPSAEVKPTQISKVNTALQLLLMGVTTISPLLSFVWVGPALQGLQYIVATTTIWSGFSYIGHSGFKILKQPGKKSSS